MIAINAMAARPITRRSTGFPFPGTSHYELAYNAITGDLDLNAA